MRRFVLLLAFVFACSSNDPATTGTGTPAPDGGGARDGASRDADSSTETTDAGADGADGATSEQDGGVGQTCIGYGAGDTCATETGKPYGYVCFDGAPPGITGCKLTRASGTLGNNYCCSENACVEQVDQGAQCNGVTGKPHRFQCPPTDADGGTVAPPSGCVEHNSGSSNVETYYCCP